MSDGRPILSDLWDGSHDGPTNMARDVELIARAESDGWACRAYGWTEAWVTLGATQDEQRALVDPANTKWVRRPTGGKGVLHGHDLTLGIAVSLERIGLETGTKDVQTVYESLVAPILAGFEGCGIAVSLGRELKATGSSGDCFAFALRNDVVDRATGIKLCGCAQRVFPNAALLQASIPVSRPLVEPHEVFRNAAPSHWIDLDQAKFLNSLAEFLASQG